MDAHPHVTLSDVARAAEVSLATASRALNGTTKVRADLRERVLAAARKLAYAPNAHAQALAGGTHRTVGVVCHDVSDPYFSEITRGIQSVASESGHLVSICSSFRDPVREMAYVRLLTAHRVEALILAGSGLDDRSYSQSMATQIESFTAFGGRVAFIGRHNIPGDAVIPDNVGGARLLGHLLAELGHRRIGVVGGPPLVTSSRDRLEGFRLGLADYGLELPSEWVRSGDFSRDGGARDTSELLELLPDLTAICALSDVMAVGVLTALKERGISVPDQVSVVGFDDVPLASDVTPTLTTVHVPMFELGKRALSLALHGEGDELRVEHLPTQIVIRQSTSRCNV